MKNLLITTALLAGTASMAYAETGVSFSGYGRFGLDYNSDRDTEAQLFSRLRFNINAKTETDSGVTFGGRIRLQYDTGIDRSFSTTNPRGRESTLNAAYVYATYEGFRVEVGNSNTAVDSAGLAFNSEIGVQDFGAGDPFFVYEEYQSRPFSASETNRAGLFISYAVGDLNARFSYVQQDQSDEDNDADEIAISGDYKFGAFTVSGAYADNAGGVENQTFFFAGGEYAVNDATNVGLQYFNVDDALDNIITPVTPPTIPPTFLTTLNRDSASKITLYGNYTFDAFTVKGFVSSLDGDVGGDVADDGTPDGINTSGEDIAFGIGVDYDLGGARLSSGIQRDFNGETQMDAGVRFDF